MSVLLMFHQFSLSAELGPTHATLESLPGLANTLGLQGGLHGWEEVQGFIQMSKNVWQLFINRHRVVLQKAL